MANPSVQDTTTFSAEELELLQQRQDRGQAAKAAQAEWLRNNAPVAPPCAPSETAAPPSPVVSSPMEAAPGAPGQGVKPVSEPPPTGASDATVQYVKDTMQMYASEACDNGNSTLGMVEYNEYVGNSDGEKRTVCIHWRLAYIGADQDFDWWRPITEVDKELHHGYNTYLYKGLPQHPIATPSENAIVTTNFKALKNNDFSNQCLIILYCGSRINIFLDAKKTLTRSPRTIL